MTALPQRIPPIRPLFQGVHFRWVWRVVDRDCRRLYRFGLCCTGSGWLPPLLISEMLP